MKVRESSEEIEAAAAAWVARLEGADASPECAAQLDTWLKADSRRQGAYVRARAAWELLSCGRALAGPEVRVAASARLTRRALLAGSAAAGLAAAIALGILVPRMGRRAVKQFQTALGDVREIALDDGSSAFLDTGSAIEVDFQPTTRRIHLQKGEAWFKVAKDSARPFVVRQGTVEVRAVGTAFSVSARGEATAVVVTEGVVELSRPGRQQFAPIRLQSGTRALLQADGRAKIEPFPADAIERTLAWREGRIGLNGETLLEAAETFNRYNAVKIVIDDPGLAAERLVGWFDMKDPRGFAGAVEISLGAVAQTRGGVIHLSFAPREKNPP